MKTKDDFPHLTKGLYDIHAQLQAIENERNIKNALPVVDFLESLDELPIGMAELFRDLHARRKAGKP